MGNSWSRVERVSATKTHQLKQVSECMYVCTYVLTKCRLLLYGTSHESPRGPSSRVCPAQTWHSSHFGWSAHRQSIVVLKGVSCVGHSVICIIKQTLTCSRLEAPKSASLTFPSESRSMFAPEVTYDDMYDIHLFIDSLHTHAHSAHTHNTPLISLWTILWS